MDLKDRAAKVSATSELVPSDDVAFFWCLVKEFVLSRGWRGRLQVRSFTLNQHTDFSDSSVVHSNHVFGEEYVNMGRVLMETHNRASIFVFLHVEKAAVN